MAGFEDNDEKLPPSVHFRSPTYQPHEAKNAPAESEDKHGGSKSSTNQLRPEDARAVTDTLGGSSRPLSTSHDIYLGSYRRPRSIGQVSSGTRTPRESRPPSVRGIQAQSHLRLDHMLREIATEQETYGVEELRDGYFDAIFLSGRQEKSLKLLEDDSSLALPIEPENNFSYMDSLRSIIYRQFDGGKHFLKRITTTRAGIKLTKSFLPYFMAYIICLIPSARNWLGRYSFIFALSTILNHSGRPVGAQLDGAVSTILGTITGLGWGSLALYVSTSTGPARAGYGGILATFMILFTAIIAYLRCVLIRVYQFVICAGIAVVYTVLADTSETVGWRKIFDYGIPWALGQALCLVVSVTVFPDAGSRALAVAFHRSMVDLHKALQLPRTDNTMIKRQLASSFVNISDAIRDFTIDLSITKFSPEDVRVLRNLIQGVIRSTIAVESSTILLEMVKLKRIEKDVGSAAADFPIYGVALDDPDAPDAVAIAISKPLTSPLQSLILAFNEMIEIVDAALLDISGYRRYVTSLGTSDQDLGSALLTLQKAIESFDSADNALLSAHELPTTYTDDPKVVDILIFAHSIRQVASNIAAFASKVLEMQRTNSYLRVNLPSYPLAKALNRTNAQVRHDRGGLTVGFYFRTKGQLERTMADLQSRLFVPLPEPHLTGMFGVDVNTDPNDEHRDEKKYLEDRRAAGTQQATFRYRIWSTLHDMQGFETRFALKVVIVTTLLSIPAWLEQSRTWWNRNDAWWAVVMVWLMMHPRVGGNFQDLTTRVLTAAIGAIWAGFAFAAGNGNPYVMAFFAAIYMIPMLYRFTQSTHPRSGLAGCISFTVISLKAKYQADDIVHLTWTLGVAFMVGIGAAVIVNWILWPFIARHELRKSVSTMLQHLAILYRGVVSKYVYYSSEEAPNGQDIERSEMLEGRLREAFVRIRQLLGLTHHEIRLRAPFDSHPYRALIDTCESFFEDLIKIRQFSLYFQPVIIQAGEAENAALLSYRRDAVASILMNMYALAGALRSNRAVPRYLPSAAAARKRLLDRMAEVHEDRSEEDNSKKRRWADVYQYAYSKALTDIVGQLEDLQQITKLITGEVGFDVTEPR